MSELLDVGITLTVIFFIIVLVWSRVEHKEIMDVLTEIRDLMNGERQ